MGAIGYATGDLHWPETAGRGSWSDLPGVSGDVEFGLRRTVELCVAHMADLYLAGDNVDGPDPEPASIAALYEILRPVCEAKLFVYYILGNHERGRDWLAPLGPRAVRLEDAKPIRTRTGKTLGGLSWQDPNVFEDRLRAVHTTDIGMYHQGFQEWTGGGRGFPVACLPRHRLTICGDTHVSDLIDDNGALRLSPGPLAPQSTTEFREHATVWRIDDDLSIHPVPIRGRKCVRYEVDRPEAADHILAKIASLDREDESLPPRLRQPLVAVRIRADIPGFVDVLRKLVETRGVHLRISDDSKSVRTKPQLTSQPGFLTLSDAVSNWPAPQDVRDLALKVIAPGADVAAILNEDLNAQTQNA